MWSCNPSVEGVEELEAVASSMAVETDEARSAVSSAGIWEDRLQGGTGDADSPQKQGVVLRLVAFSHQTLNGLGHAQESIGGQQFVLTRII